MPTHAPARAIRRWHAAIIITLFFAAVAGSAAVGWWYARESPAHQGPILLISIGVLVLRVTEPDRPRPFKVPFVWPVALLSTAACLFIMVGLPWQAWERFFVWLALGALIYVFYGYRHSRLRGPGS